MVEPNTYVSEWYAQNYPDDPECGRISYVTFEELLEAMENGEDFYQVIGDSIVRERIFDEMTQLFSPTNDYDDIYYLWLEGRTFR